MSSGEAHQLRGRDRVIVDLGGKDRLEPSSFRGPPYILDLCHPPSGAGDDTNRQALRHTPLPLWFFLHMFDQLILPGVSEAGERPRRTVVIFPSCSFSHDVVANPLAFAPGGVS